MAKPTAICRLCGSSRLVREPFGYNFHGKWLQGIHCSDCDVIFIHPQPEPEEIPQMYSKRYFEGDFRCGHAGSYFDAHSLDRLVDRSLLQRIKMVVPKGRFLEIGCAGGAFLDAARRIGYEVRGVEFSEDAAAFARQHFRLDVITGDVLDASLQDETFDVIFMGDVLEHLPDPVTTLQEINRIVVRGGLIVLALPSQTNTLFSRFGFFLYGALGKKVAVNLPPYHLFEYRPKSISNLLRRCGFEITGVTQGSIPPREITLRGSLLQRIGKKTLQYPNYVLTSVIGKFGDRLEIFATKR